MKVLNVEDNVFKHTAICRALQKVGIKEVAWKRNLADALEEIQNSMKSEPYELAITDMWYPEYPGGPDAKSGKLFIEKNQSSECPVKVILCSSIDYDWPDILGSVHYSENEDWENRLLELVRKSR